MCSSPRAPCESNPPSSDAGHRLVLAQQRVDGGLGFWSQSRFRDGRDDGVTIAPPGETLCAGRRIIATSVTTTIVRNCIKESYAGKAAHAAEGNRKETQRQQRRGFRRAGQCERIVKAVGNELISGVARMHAIHDQIARYAHRVDQ